MCLPYPSLSPAQPSSDEEEGERQSPPLEVSDGEADGLEPGPGLLHGETGRGMPRASLDPARARFHAHLGPSRRTWQGGHRAESTCVCVRVCERLPVCFGGVPVSVSAHV